MSTIKRGKDVGVNVMISRKRPENVWIAYGHKNLSISRVRVYSITIHLAALVIYMHTEITTLPHHSHLHLPYHTLHDFLTALIVTTSAVRRLMTLALPFLQFHHRLFNRSLIRTILFRRQDITRQILQTNQLRLIYVPQTIETFQILFPSDLFVFNKV